MTLAFRRFLYISFILAFLIITPLVIAYAAGYELVFSMSKPIRFQKTGMLILDSTPAGALIYINGDLQQMLINRYLDKVKIFGSKSDLILTPAKIKNLLPGEYDVRLELDGYWPWQKKLIVKGGESTYAEDVFLFKKNLPLRLSPGRFDNLSISPDFSFFAGISEDNLVVGSTAENTVSTIKIKPGDKRLKWSPAGNSLIIGDFIYKTAPLEASASIASSTGLECSKLQWDTIDSRRLYCLAGDVIAAINLENRSSSKIISSENIIDFFIKSGYAYVINRSADGQKLSIYKTDPQTHITDFNLSKPFEYEFINPGSKYINLYNDRQKSLSLIDVTGSEPLVETLNNVNYSVWIENDKMLYNNDSEIWTYGFPGGEKTLLTRISFPIKKVMLHPSKNYVIFSTDNSIYDIELDNREKRSITELFKADHITSPALSKDGDSILFIGKIGSQEGVYQLFIQ